MGRHSNVRVLPRLGLPYDTFLPGHGPSNDRAMRQLYIFKLTHYKRFSTGVSGT